MKHSSFGCMAGVATAITRSGLLHDAVGYVTEMRPSDRPTKPKPDSLRRLRR